MCIFHCFYSQLGTRVRCMRLHSTEPCIGMCWVRNKYPRSSTASHKQLDCNPPRSIPACNCKCCFPHKCHARTPVSKLLLGTDLRRIPQGKGMCWVLNKDLRSGKQDCILALRKFFLSSRLHTSRYPERCSFHASMYHCMYTASSHVRTIRLHRDTCWYPRIAHRSCMASDIMVENVGRWFSHKLKGFLQ
jgi:hypothetical protein